ncbi:MAG: hypothetical protein AB8B65_08600 [Kordia sp.]|uniref:hypothetical protein n=1 Tax=Kordia sp. TaxID=1965332 RepID=UPI00385EF470
MKKYIVLIFTIILASCVSLSTKKAEIKKQLIKPELMPKLSKGFVIQKLPNWQFHGFHNVLHYTPKELMDVGDEFIYNSISASNNDSKGESLQSIVDRSINKRMNTVKITNFKMFKEPTQYGESIIVTYDSKISGKEYKTIKQYYKYKSRVYRVFFSARKKNFDKYSKDAIRMMKTFTITE